jgi:hypothetical protein
MAITHELTPSDQRDVGGRSVIVETSNPFDPPLGNATTFQFRGQTVLIRGTGTETTLPIDDGFRFGGRDYGRK